MLEAGAADTASVAALVSVSSCAAVVGKGHLHFDGLAFVGIGQGVSRAGSACDCSVVGQPLVGEGGVRETVSVLDARCVRPSTFPQLGPYH